mmetsp:Transcript_23205/g.46314  ORF Transcript_23205/g.46314 Transcript_23205/m.46314 type:complete len:86 (-) Transcript_23205:23-280(-)
MSLEAKGSHLSNESSAMGREAEASNGGPDTMGQKAKGPSSKRGPWGTLKILVGGAGQIKLTKDGNVLFHEMQIKHHTASQQDPYR